MAMQLRAIEVVRSIATLAPCDLGLELRQPARCHLREGEPRRERQLPDPGNALKQFVPSLRFVDCWRAERAKA